MITGFLTVDWTGTPGHRMTNTPSTIFNKATFWGYSSVVSGIPVTNASTIYVGNSPNFLSMGVTKNSYFNLESPGRKKEDLYNLFYGGASGDGVHYVGY